MFYNEFMNDELQKLSSFGPYMDVETAEEEGCNSHQPPADGGMCQFATPENVNGMLKDMPIHMAALPGGRRVPMLKTMLTSACERNCNYCAFRSGRDFRRETFKPDEMAKTFMLMHQKGLVEGIFLSSGVAGGGVRTQDRLIATAELLRTKYHFKGYMHLKLMPGSEQDQVRQAMRFSDRVSINLEAPNNQRLSVLAPEKRFLDELLQPLRWVEEIRRNESTSQAWNGRWSSSVTQFVVGGGEESDLELLTTSSYLIHQLKLGRVYYSRFKPVEDTPLANRSATNPWREHRLYQASFLLRDYGFDAGELPFLKEGNLPLDTDPKLAWAKNNLFDTPVELNRADYQQLLRVPGIGPLTARRIIDIRQRSPLKQLDDLKRLGVVSGRAAPYILLQGRHFPSQMALW